MAVRDALGYGCEDNGPLFSIVSAGTFALFWQAPGQPKIQKVVLTAI